jgi:hypothetical protein
VAALAASPTVATLLPGVTLHLGLPPAPGRALVDAGAAVALGTDLNPGSSPVFSAALPAALAVRLNGLTPAEALVAATVNAAARSAAATGAGWPRGAAPTCSCSTPATGGSWSTRSAGRSWRGWSSAVGSGGRRVASRLSFDDCLLIYLAPAHRLTL